jgi:hypothetical protein
VAGAGVIPRSSRSRLGPRCGSRSLGGGIAPRGMCHAGSVLGYYSGKAQAVPWAGPVVCAFTVCVVSPANRVASAPPSAPAAPAPPTRIDALRRPEQFQAVVEEERRAIIAKGLPAIAEATKAGSLARKKEIRQERERRLGAAIKALPEDRFGVASDLGQGLRRHQLLEPQPASIAPDRHPRRAAGPVSRHAASVDPAHHARPASRGWRRAPRRCSRRPPAYLPGRG